MRPTTRIQVGVASGRGEFPFDMLRYDECWPYQSDDASRIPRDFDEPRAVRRAPRAVVVVTFARPGSFTVARWESFGWSFKAFEHTSAAVAWAREVNRERDLALVAAPAPSEGDVLEQRS